MTVVPVVVIDNQLDDDIRLVVEPPPRSHSDGTVVKEDPSAAVDVMAGEVEAVAGSDDVGIVGSTVDAELSAEVIVEVRDVAVLL